MTNGFEAYYDTELQITWLADANHAYTSGYSTTEFGRMTWAATDAWITGTVNAGGGLYGAAWRLPTMSPVDGSSTYKLIPGPGNAGYFDGSIDYSINNAAKSNELGYMYYQNLGLLAYADTGGNANNPHGFSAANVTLTNAVSGGFGNLLQTADVAAGGSTFRNVSIEEGFWTGSKLDNPAGWGSGPWAFALYTSDGQMDLLDASAAGPTYAAWLVTNGDPFNASPVPEPTSLAMLLAGAGTIGAARRRKRAIGA